MDGTYNFASGSDYFCPALALVEGEASDPARILTSAIHRPALATTWVADSGTASRNGRTLEQGVWVVRVARR